MGQKWLAAQKKIFVNNWSLFLQGWIPNLQCPSSEQGCSDDDGLFSQARCHTSSVPAVNEDAVMMTGFSQVRCHTNGVPAVNKDAVMMMGFFTGQIPHQQCPSSERGCSDDDGFFTGQMPHQQCPSSEQGCSDDDNGVKNLY